MTSIRKEKSPLNVLLVTLSYPSADNQIKGKFVREQAKAISGSNKVAVIHSYPVPPRFSQFFRTQKNVEDGIVVVRVTYPALLFLDPVLFFFGVCMGVWELVKKSKFKPHLIHAHFFMAGLPSVFFGRLFNIPVVISEHWSGFSRHQLRWHGRIIAKFVMSKATITCPVSEALKKSIQSYGIVGNFRVLPNTIDTNIFHPQQTTKTKTRGQKRVLIVANMVPVKGIPTLLAAFKLLASKRQDFVLDIIGDGPQRGEYAKLATVYGLNSYVRFHGQLPPPVVADFMNATDFFVLSSEWESHPNVLIEALACGKPVVATNVGGVKEIVTQQAGILVPSKSPDTLADALDNMLDSYSTYSASYISSLAFDKFSFKAVSKQLDEIYLDSLVLHARRGS